MIRTQDVPNGDLVNGVQVLAVVHVLDAEVLAAAVVIRLASLDADLARAERHLGELERLRGRRATVARRGADRLHGDDAVLAVRP